MATNEVQVAAPAPSRFAPVIDLSSGMTDLQVSQQFDLARSQVDAAYVTKTKVLVEEKENSEKSSILLKFAGFTAAVLVIGYVAAKVIGLLIAGGLSLFAAIGVWYFWNYKLPSIIESAKRDLVIKAKEAAAREKELLNQIEIDHLKKLKEQAHANPIETLELDLQTMYGERDALKSAITIFRTHATNLAADLAQSRKENPEADFSEEAKQLQDLATACDSDDAELTDFIQAISQMEKILKEARAKWNFAVKMDAALAERDKARGNEAQRKILADTALNAVREKNAELFARIHTRAVELSAKKTVKVAGQNIDVSAVIIKTN